MLTGMHRTHRARMARPQDTTETSACACSHNNKVPCCLCCKDRMAQQSRRMGCAALSARARRGTRTSCARWHARRRASSSVPATTARRARLPAATPHQTRMQAPPHLTLLARAPCLKLELGARGVKSRARWYKGYNTYGGACVPEWQRMYRARAGGRCASWRRTARALCAGCPGRPTPASARPAWTPTATACSPVRRGGWAGGAGETAGAPQGLQTAARL